MQELPLKISIDISAGKTRLRNMNWFTDVTLRLEAHWKESVDVQAYHIALVT